MRYIKLGRSGLDVSPIAIGAMTYGEPGRGHPVWSLAEDDSRPLIKHAVEAGINFFDTANIYSQEFSKALHLQTLQGWTRFVAMQDHYNLLAREEEREMLPLCADEGVGTIVWSPLARGRLARPWNQPTARSAADPFADMLYTNADS